ncbi:MAG: aminomethyl-transferring glycine dehydrogenase subunit GcvPA [Thermodesulfobacteriota bacterium]
MHYFPHTEEDLTAMLRTVGLERLEDLFRVIPEACRRKKPLELPEPLTEWELNDHMDRLSGDMAAPGKYTSFLGAGRYEHVIPHLIPSLTGRPEFSTAYTPYQPEVSQGTLQAIYEYQTLTGRLLGLPVANASLYDGASSLAEALLMAMRITKKRRIALSRVIHPLFLKVVETYLGPTDHEILLLPYGTDGRTDLSPALSAGDLAAIAVQSPNFFGCIEDLDLAAETARRQQALCITAFTEAMAYGLLKNPGSRGADIACGEGQSLGIPVSYGGPGLGMLACKGEYVRSLPGRLVGETVDVEGRRGYVLTLATREQHIRREKATSNICTNGSLCALTAAMFMAAAGRRGFREIARLNHDKTAYLKAGLASGGAVIPFRTPVFNEFVVRFPDGFENRYEELLQQKIIAGLPLETFYPELAGHYLLTVTETKTREQLDAFIREVGA